MRDEDIDWKIYHLIPDGTSVPIAELAEKTCLDEETVRASLSRLEKSRLIMVRGEIACPLSITDFIFASQLANAPAEDDCGIYIENGVIKVRK